MKISEIVTIENPHEFIDDYKFKLRNATITSTDKEVNGVILNIAKLHPVGFDNGIYALVTLDGVVVSILEFGDRENEKLFISKTITRRKPINFQNAGCFKFLLDTVVSDFGELLSDTHQTDYASAAWKSLIRNNNSLYFYIFNCNTDDYYQLTLDSVDEIYGDHLAHLVISACKSPQSASTFDIEKHK